MLQLLSEYKELLGGGATGLAFAIVVLKMGHKNLNEKVQALELDMHREIDKIKLYVDDKHKDIKEQVLDLKVMIRSGFDKLENRIYDLSKNNKEQ